MSVIAIAVRHLIVAGASPDQIVHAVAEMELASRAQPRSKHAEAQARYRVKGKDDPPSPVITNDHADHKPSQVITDDHPDHGDHAPSTPPFLSSLAGEPLAEVQESKNGSCGRASGWSFAAFWEKFPNKVGKKDAQRRFEHVRKSGAVEFSALMAGLDRYLGKTDDRPWCNPATWLNGGRWDDQPAAANGARSATADLMSGLDSGRFYAAAESPQLAAWDAHRQATTGRSVARDRNGGWWFDSEWPPGHAEQSPPDRNWQPPGDPR